MLDTCHVGFFFPFLGIDLITTNSLRLPHALLSTQTLPFLPQFSISPSSPETLSGPPRAAAGRRAIALGGGGDGDPRPQVSPPSLRRSDRPRAPLFVPLEFLFLFVTWSWLVAALGGGRGYLCAGSSSFDDPDVVEVTPAAAAAGGWSSGHQKRKRSQVMWEGASSISPLFVVHDFIIFFWWCWNWEP